MRSRLLLVGALVFSRAAGAKKKTKKRTKRRAAAATDQRTEQERLCDARARRAASGRARRRRGPRRGEMAADARFHGRATEIPAREPESAVSLQQKAARPRRRATRIVRGKTDGDDIGA